eukprot:GHUV01055272.1.p1 GENE.GHUV01055272.1~~GHUV01055272.1.p1  ORF type:complete len:121 (+),score=5.24 GHUV01055272.1:248-610(+)
MCPLRYATKCATWEGEQAIGVFCIRDAGACVQQLSSFYSAALLEPADTPCRFLVGKVFVGRQLLIKPVVDTPTYSSSDKAKAVCNPHSDITAGAAVLSCSISHLHPPLSGLFQRPQRPFL